MSNKNTAQTHTHNSVRSQRLLIIGYPKGTQIQANNTSLHRFDSTKNTTRAITKLSGNIKMVRAIVGYMKEMTTRYM